MRPYYWRGGLFATSKVELFVVIVNTWKPLTIITKSSTLDVAAVLDPPLLLGFFTHFDYSFFFLMCFYVFIFLFFSPTDTDEKVTCKIDESIILQLKRSVNWCDELTSD